MKFIAKILGLAVVGVSVITVAYAATTEFVDDVVISTSKSEVPVLSASGRGGVVFTGSLSQGNLPATGEGVRMMWAPRRAAFRAGHVSGTNWDLDLVGRYSVAMGYDSLASGESTLAIGDTVTASGSRAVAMGDGTTASGVGAVGMGINVVSSGSASFASGRLTTAAAHYSVALGYSSTASASYSTAFGDRAIASGAYSIAGSRATATGNYSTALGLTENPSYMGVTIGRYNVIEGSQTGWSGTDPLLILGNGTGTSNRSNAFVVRKNGNVEMTGTVTLPRQGDILMGEFGN